MMRKDKGERGGPRLRESAREKRENLEGGNKKGKSRETRGEKGRWIKPQSFK